MGSPAIDSGAVMPRLLSAIAFLSAMACAACGDVTLKDPDAVDARVDAPDAQPGAPDAQPDAPDARPDAPDARVPPDAGPPCVEGDAQIQDPGTGACYMLFTAVADWFDARDACANLDPSAHLATLTSFDEHVLVLGLTVGFEAWLGATDAALEGEFVWVTGDLVEFAAWAANEPNNGGTNGEDCAMLINAGNRAGTWDDRGCGASLPYVCERD
jgi:hypothetical protein